MKKLITLLLITTVLFGISVPAFASNNTMQDSRFYLTEETTLGDVMRYTDLSTYNSLPIDMKMRIDSTPYADTPNNDPQNRAGLYIFATLTGTAYSYSTRTLTYNSQLTVDQTCPYLYNQLCIYDNTTNEMVEYSVESEGNTVSVLVSGVATGLKTKHQYRIVASGFVTTPAGYYPMDPIIRTAYATTK